MDKLSLDGLEIPVYGRGCIISESDTDLDGSDGLFHPTTFTIEIRSNLSHNDKLRVLFHELGHAVIDRLGLALDAHLEEILVTGFESLFAETFDVDAEILIQRYGQK